ncbi:STAS domain-containing protein [Aestuariicella hydrocarbonica]|uniref:STAS domain-containing protein n=1 Tax=Pseudomaricurvus hydrocarbonicus TaxID=1470433 RepID=A0A9E5MHB8_9GAMM|nr:STAS domain-containing protein [Aestuariicella hydrocarbonica]NHO65751.1 STAS domain-containing protein [Aestuariicella hydrocarbonica]
MVDHASLSFSNDTLSVEGSVDFSNVVALCHSGDQWLRDQAPEHCKIDFGKVSRCNSAATTLLLSWMRTAKSVGKVASIDQVPPALRSLMDLGGLDMLLMKE